MPLPILTIGPLRVSGAFAWSPSGDSIAFIDGALSNGVRVAMLDLRSFMFERVYLQQDHAPAQATVSRIFEELVGKRGMSIEDATDYLAGMTDRFALTFVAELD